MSTVTPTSNVPQRLPVWSTLGRACVLWAKNLPELLRVSWLWLIVTAPVLCLFWWWGRPYYNTSMQAIRAHHPDPTPALTIVLGALNSLIMLPMLASIAVAWHRLLLRSERRATATYLRFDRIVVLYTTLSFSYLLLLYASNFLAQVARQLGRGGRPTSIATALLPLFVWSAGIAVMYVTARLIVYLPAKALDRQDITLAKVWRATRDNGWRLFFGHLLALLLLLPVAVLSSWMPEMHVSRTLDTVIAVAISVIVGLGGMIAVGFLSLAYRHFFEDWTAQEAWRVAYGSSGSAPASATRT